MSGLDDAFLMDVQITEESVVFAFLAPGRVEAWIENRNKHLPHILSVLVDDSCVRLERRELRIFFDRHPGQVCRLCLCTRKKRVAYTVSNSLLDCRVDGISISFERDAVCFCKGGTKPKRYPLPCSSFAPAPSRRTVLERTGSLPVETVVIGSCFSRSLFRSDSYFNPEYQAYFHVCKTLFHNSFISLFSQALPCDHAEVEDLRTGDAAKYIGIEFKKDMEETFAGNCVRLVVVDNYIDATTPVIRYEENSYLTYNKYFSESIFKRFFSGCDVIEPGTSVHLELYRRSIQNLRTLLCSHRVPNVVLTGGRLCPWKINEQTGEISTWNDKMEWIKEVNLAWDSVDRIFLEEIPEAIYLDMRHTTWKSDVHSPILGGASPSHYQREFYKELFDKMKGLLKGGSTDEI